MVPIQYTEGEMAFEQGRPISANPYPKSDDPNSPHRWWARGWLAASDAKEIDDDDA